MKLFLHSSNDLYKLIETECFFLWQSRVEMKSEKFWESLLLTFNECWGFCGCDCKISVSQKSIESLVLCTFIVQLNNRKKYLHFYRRRLRNKWKLSKGLGKLWTWRCFVQLITQIFKEHLLRKSLYSLDCDFEDTFRRFAR